MGPRGWMRAVGTISLLLGIGSIPPINEARVPFAFLFAEGAEGTLLFKAFLDYSFAFGIDLLVLGGFLWWAARRPADHIWLVWLVVWIEAFRVVGDALALTRGYPESMNWVFGGFIAFHIAVVVTGVQAKRGICSRLTPAVRVARDRSGIGGCPSNGAPRGFADDTGSRDQGRQLLELEDPRGRSSVWKSTGFASRGSWVRVPSSPLREICCAMVCADGCLRSNRSAL